MSTVQTLPINESTFKKDESVSQKQLVSQPTFKEIELFSWTAAARPFKRRDKEFYVTLIAIASVVGLVLFIAEGLMPVAMIAALIFLYYVLHTVEPGEITYSITTKGIKIAGERTDWSTITQFWFGHKLDNHLLILGTLILPGKLELVINEADKEIIRQHLTNYANEEEAPPSRLEKWANSFSKKLPGN